jgi:beta-lactamase class A
LGINAVTNDVGLVTLPSGRPYAIAVFVCGSDKPAALREKLIAHVAGARVEALR